MGFIFNGIPAAEVTISGNVSTSLDSKSISSCYASATTQAMVIGTVPAGKKWKIKGWHFYLSATAQTSTLAFAGTTVARYLGTTASSSTGTVYFANDEYITTLTAGQTITSSAPAAFDRNYTIFYNEEDA